MVSVRSVPVTKKIPSGTETAPVLEAVRSVCEAIHVSWPLPLLSGAHLELTCGSTLPGSAAALAHAMCLNLLSL